MDIQRLQSRVIVQTTVMYSILPAIERSDGVLLESIPVYGMLTVKWVGSQDRDRGFAQHYDIIDRRLSVVEKSSHGDEAADIFKLVIESRYLSESCRPSLPGFLNV